MPSRVTRESSVGPRSGSRDNHGGSGSRRLGLLFFAGFVWKAGDFWFLSRRGTHTDGVCSDQVTDDGISTSTITFSHEGREYGFTETTTAASVKITLGDTCRVRYDPCAPGRATLASERTGLHALAWLAMTGLWIVLAVIAIRGPDNG
ncbi:DUF3592 domain-containing protein [Kitasatospora sp. NPDC093550]|uniref:DUF3592 domain-containing protein n=1 Tax=Kitasatospora sp. NPDC093550 TaxID=3364089 RepID=UPI0037FCB5E1